ncbi:ribosome-associated ATPase/putative transporter RbbA [Citreicella sp. C3M06]|uniref:ribosome-associated ATPase/putative transporter RbbA n=1 Tax=Citreicella sp. C3M06 TaxID=2841564 RepID=UPI001C0A1D2C|nr:ribosome-associated ATPase/putative transporter RbbA [Citreicella sp. C3M06]MBU2963119.1 ribosome-associated ATPase/putative transporter RbbA [Citreicella sp. C3M06]
MTVVFAQGLTQRYGAVTALDDVTVSLPAGQMVGLLGPDGVGKSTLLDLIAGARVMQTGDLQVLGGDMRAPGHRRKAGPRIAYMPQGLGKNLYHALSVAENMEFFGNLFGLDAKSRRARIERLTRATGMHAFLDRPAGKLSGGMKQKLGLCCSLLHDPDLLILDEPTTGVDPLSRRQFWQLIGTIRADRPEMSVLVSTAYMDEAEEFDWLVAMDAGRVLDTGTPEALKTRTGTADLESAFVQLLPKDKRGEQNGLIIPPLAIDDGPPAISARGLTKRFGTFAAVSDVNFDIRRGEIFGFLGSNGCGKTTTMKMLTGLLPISEGQADMFGQPVDASDLKARKRVGFMSQTFSLYGELTVRQNLDLHARLFEMPREYARKRIAALVARFGLGPHLDLASGALPLGLRQRLSLAIAVLHEPEVLILDEPTSGVDPVARDKFWELLVELSRGDGVTIFISTHFMNEAMRCDRISLMHAGQVLVVGSPDDIAATSPSGSIEDSFIHHIETAIAGSGATSEAPAAPESRQLGASMAHSPTSGGFSLRRMAAISLREWREVRRDPIRLAFAFFGSIFLTIVFSLGISMDVEDISMAALDLDQSPASREYLSAFYGSPTFAEQPELLTRDEIVTRMASGALTVAMEIPPGFGQDLKQGRDVTVSTWIDGANTTRAGTIEAYVTGAHYAALEDGYRREGIDPDDLASYDIQSRYRYNPTFESIRAIGPAVPAILLMMFPAILMAISVAREKEIGTITNFYVTPTSRVEFFVGKQIPYVLITLVNALSLALVVTFGLGVSLTGSLAALLVGSALYGAAVTSYGLLISSATRTQVAAIFATAILSMMPTIQFSGMIQPISTLNGGGQLIGELWPASYFMHLSVGAYTKGLSFGQLVPDMLALAGFVPVFLIPALLLLRKQER